MSQILGKETLMRHNRGDCGCWTICGGAATRIGDRKAADRCIVAQERRVFVSARNNSR